MKRSTQIGLAAAGVVLVATVWSLSSDDAKGDVAYSSIDECKADAQVSAQQCETLFADAAAKRLAEAPKFQNQSSCEAQYGANGCSTARIGGVEYFLPALAGFMLARSLSGAGGQPQAAPLLPPTREACPPGSSQPGSGKPECQQPARSSSSSGSSSSYGSSSSRAYSTTSGSALVARSGGSTSGGVSTPSVSSRGGFGSTSHSFSSSSSS